MATTQKKTSSRSRSGGSRSASGAKKSGGSRSSASRAAVQAPIRREVGGAVCLLLALCAAGAVAGKLYLDRTSGSEPSPS